MSGQAGRYQRSAAGMIGAMLVLVAVILGFVVVRDLLREDPIMPVRDVDYAQAAEYARQTAEFDLLAPASLPEGWRATSVDFRSDPDRWHLGLLTDRGEYVGLEQSAASPRSMVEAYVDPEAVQGEDVTVAGDRWSTWTDEGGDTALVRSTQGTTTLVVGTADREVLADFVTRLE